MKGKGGKGAMSEERHRAECFPYMLAALKEALPIIEQDIKDIGPCDHEANLCVCGLKSTVETIRAALAQAEEEA